MATPTDDPSASASSDSRASGSRRRTRATATRINPTQPRVGTPVSRRSSTSVRLAAADVSGGGGGGGATSSMFQTPTGAAAAAPLPPVGSSGQGGTSQPPPDDSSVNLDERLGVPPPPVGPPASGLGTGGAGGGGGGRRRNVLLELTVRRPVAVLTVVVAICVFGLVAYGRLPLQLLPNFDYPRLTVRTDYPTASPEMVEDEVSVRVEEGIGAVSNLVQKSSISRAEQSEVTLQFDWGTDLSEAATEVRQRIDRLRLPGGAEPPLVLRYDPTLEPILRIAIAPSAERIARMTRADRAAMRLELRQLAENLLQPELEKLPGIAAARVLGGSSRVVDIRVREAQLEEFGLSISDIATHLQNQNVEQPLGSIEEGQREYLIRLRNRYESLDQIRRDEIRRGVPLSAVAEVTFGEEDPEIRTRFAGRPSVEIEILKEADANIVRVAREVWERLYGTTPYRLTDGGDRYIPVLGEDEVVLGATEPETAEPADGDGDGDDDGSGEEEAPSGAPLWELLRGSRGKVPFERYHAATISAYVDNLDNDDSGGGGWGGRSRVAATQDLAQPLIQLMPAGIGLTVLADQSYFIEDAIAELQFTALFGGALAVLILLLFLRQIGRTMIVALAIPVSVMATFTPMYLFDISLNLMSFGGLALGLGMLVDNAVVVLESIARCREEGDNPREAAIRGISEVFGAIVAATATTVVVFFPVAFVDGVAGQIFGDQALTIVFSLLMSLLVAIFVIPVLAALTFGGRKEPIQPGRLLRPRFLGGWVRAARTLWRFAWLDLARRWLGRRAVGDGPSTDGHSRFRAQANDSAKQIGMAGAGPLSNEVPGRSIGGAPRARLSDRHEGTPRQVPGLGEALVERPRKRGLTGRLRFMAWVVATPAVLPLAVAGGLLAFGAALLNLLVTSVIEVVWRYIALVPVMFAAWLALKVARRASWATKAVFWGPLMAFDQGFRAVTSVYKRLLGAALRHAALVVVMAGLAMGAGWYVFQTLDSELIPKLRQGEFSAQFTLAEGRPLIDTARAIAVIEDALAAPEIAKLVDRTTLIVGEARDPSGERLRRENYARLTIIMTRGSGPDAEATVRDAIRTAARTSAYLAPPEFAVPTLFTLSTPLEVELRGSNLERIRDAARTVESLMQTLTTADLPDAAGEPKPLFDEVRTTVRRGNPEIRFRFDQETLAQFDLTPQQAANILRDLLEGSVPTDFTLDGERVDMRVELDDADKPDLAAVRDLRLAPGLTVREATRDDIREGPSEIRRRDNQRLAIVSASPAEGVALSEALGVLQRALEADPPAGVIVKYAGQSQEMGESFGSLLGALLLAVFLVYVVMAIQFESIVQPLVILLTVPLALIGVVGVLAALDLPISIVVIIGVIVLAGIVVNNAIVLIDRINYNRRRGMPIDDAIVEGGAVRLRPITITVLTTVLGLLPLTGWIDPLLGWTGLVDVLGEGAEVRAPMAITIVVGLLFSTLLTLIVIPVVYRVLTGGRDMTDGVDPRDPADDLRKRLPVGPGRGVEDSSGSDTFAGGGSGGADSGGARGGGRAVPAYAKHEPEEA